MNNKQKINAIINKICNLPMYVWDCENEEVRKNKFKANVWGIDIYLTPRYMSWRPIITIDGLEIVGDYPEMDEWSISVEKHFREKHLIINPDEIEDKINEIFNIIKNES